MYIEHNLFFYLRIWANAFHMGHFDLLKTCTPTMSNREMNIVPKYIYLNLLFKSYSSKVMATFHVKERRHIFSQKNMLLETIGYITFVA